MIKPEEVYRIGRIGKPHGVKGELQLQFDDDIFDTTDADYLVLEIDGILVPFFIEEYRFRSDSVALMKLEDIDTQEQARELVGAEVFFPRALAEEREEDLSWQQLVGYRATEAATGAPLGTITGIDMSTVNTLLEVATPDGRDMLIPAAADFVKDVDTEKQEVLLDLPEGLLELN